MKTVSPARPGLTLLRCLNERLSHLPWDRVGLANPVGALRHDFRLRDIRFQQFLHLGGILTLPAQTHHLHGNHSLGQLLSMPWQTLRRLGCRRVSIKTSSANDTAQVTLVSALAHDWYLLCKPLARSRASQHGTRKTAAARLHLRVRRRQPAADCGIDRETDSIAARGADSTTVRDAFRCRPLQVVAPPSWRLEQSSHETSESRPLHTSRKSAYRSD